MNRPKIVHPADDAGSSPPRLLASSPPRLLGQRHPHPGGRENPPTHLVHCKNPPGRRKRL
ncbi:hypothetical protein ACFOLD_16765 [Kocuria carniphila]|uniref:hypothetical protein n=1 Tax=Kocuria carniphila TaxID=262208 RepID=UPI003611B510